MTVRDPLPPAANAASPPASSRALERAAILLVGAGLTTIVAVTFVTSFDAVSAVAAQRQAVSPRLAWAIPLAIDGLIVVGSAAAWLEAVRSQRWHPFPVLLVASAGALSVAANVAHADGGDWLARILAGVPPVALLAAVELGAWLLRRQARRAPRDTTLSPSVSPETPALSPGDSEATPQLQSGPARERIAAALRTRLDAGVPLEEISKDDVADTIGVHRSTVYKRWDEAAASVSSNGDGA